MCIYINIYIYIYIFICIYIYIYQARPTYIHIYIHHIFIYFYKSLKPSFWTISQRLKIRDPSKNHQHILPHLFRPISKNRFFQFFIKSENLNFRPREPYSDHFWWQNRIRRALLIYMAPVKLFFRWIKCPGPMGPWRSPPGRVPDPPGPPRKLRKPSWGLKWSVLGHWTPETLRFLWFFQF